MIRLLYFATGYGLDAQEESYINLASNIAGIIPISTTTTSLYFSFPGERLDDVNQRDKVIFTHDNTTNTTGHRCKDISRAIAQAANASPNNTGGLIDIVDLDNNIFYGNLNFVTGLEIWHTDDASAT